MHGRGRMQTQKQTQSKIGPSKVQVKTESRTGGFLSWDGARDRLTPGIKGNLRLRKSVTGTTVLYRISCLSYKCAGKPYHGSTLLPVKSEVHYNSQFHILVSDKLLWSISTLWYPNAQLCNCVVPATETVVLRGVLSKRFTSFVWSKHTQDSNDSDTFIEATVADVNSAGRGCVVSALTATLLRHKYKRLIAQNTQPDIAHDVICEYIETQLSLYRDSQAVYEALQHLFIGVDVTSCGLLELNKKLREAAEDTDSEEDRAQIEGDIEFFVKEYLSHPTFLRKQRKNTELSIGQAGEAKHRNCIIC
ncbi:hypothetical protein FISHEDRAFT_55278 [Fistulina hepatica ATCC 64428]|uniref:Uncharacterized protein n=1 Tax=Fistulina hepatica ATCC 64428 TaxID=1128425 RepID=A0A0D7AQT9_9AGAR|nr:hypothetical protein FISHEDRAFT_55278 [Fistulina hepatica ATCC 64428]